MKHRIENDAVEISALCLSELPLKAPAIANSTTK
jgi:hypothetical protein